MSIPIRLMGRSRVLLTHSRNIDVSMSAVTILYKIPLYSERGFIGEFKTAIVKDGYLVIAYEATKEAKGYIKPPIVFEKTEREVTFE